MVQISINSDVYGLYVSAFEVHDTILTP